MIFRTIVIDIIQALQYYGLYALIGSFLLMLALFSTMCLLQRESILKWMRNRWRYLFGVYLLCAYGLMVISITILSRPEGSRIGVNLEPFATISSQLWGIVYPIENILLFIPLGLLLPLLWRIFNNLGYTVGVGLLFSALIEIVQYVTKRGYLQTDDILTNVLGTLIGYIIYSSINYNGILNTKGYNSPH